MSGERQWVETVKRDLMLSLGRGRIFVETGHRLPYAAHISGYGGPAHDPIYDSPQPYQTDLLVAERRPGSTEWVPRVVVEFKLGKITSHDALTYSAKAGTHKNVHPYLRYGIVIGDFNEPLPRRLLWHGHEFDFMLTLPSKKLTDADSQKLVRLLRDEIRASRSITAALSGKSGARLMHSKLIVRSET